eukprot:5811088-Alexandrium_andersonii.AAC.1
MVGTRVPEASRQVERGPQPQYVSDRAVIQVDLGNVEQFKDAVIARVRPWQPDQPAINLVKSA